jgi:hypothetical protein
VIGPPPNGICGACGAAGPYYVGDPNSYPMPSTPWQPGKIEFYPSPLTADDVRRIIREELERHRNTDTSSAGAADEAAEVQK